MANAPHGERGDFLKVTATLSPEVYKLVSDEMLRRKLAREPNAQLSAILREAVLAYLTLNKMLADQTHEAAGASEKSDGIPRPWTIEAFYSGKQSKSPTHWRVVMRFKTKDERDAIFGRTIFDRIGQETRSAYDHHAARLTKFRTATERMRCTRARQSVGLKSVDIDVPQHYSAMSVGA